jgi:hypothetical protein
MKELSKAEQQAVGGGDAWQDLIDDAAEVARRILEDLRRLMPNPFPKIRHDDAKGWLQTPLPTAAFGNKCVKVPTDARVSRRPKTPLQKNRTAPHEVPFFCSPTASHVCIARKQLPAKPSRSKLATSTDGLNRIPLPQTSTGLCVCMEPDLEPMAPKYSSAMVHRYWHDGIFQPIFYMKQEIKNANS